MEEHKIFTFDGKTYVIFGGGIGVSACVGKNDVAVVFNELDQKHHIGEDLKAKGYTPNLSTPPIVYLMFDNADSIDVVIENLRRCKELLNNKKELNCKKED